MRLTIPRPRSRLGGASANSPSQPPVSQRDLSREASAQIQRTGKCVRVPELAMVCAGSWKSGTVLNRSACFGPLARSGAPFPIECPE